MNHHPDWLGLELWVLTECAAPNARYYPSICRQIGAADYWLAPPEVSSSTVRNFFLGRDDGSTLLGPFSSPEEALTTFNLLFPGAVTELPSF